MVRRFSEYLLIKSSDNLQKNFLRYHEDLRKLFIEDLLKIPKRTLNEIFNISSTMSRVWDSSFLDRLRLESESLTKDSKSESESYEKIGTQTQV